jgi:CubicO group peptidase (beta-lactamase class C family)
MGLIAPTHTVDVPDWVTYPDADWIEITPEEAGLDPVRFGNWLASLDVRGARFGGEDHSGNRYGAVLTRGGYLVREWGDRHYRHHTASVGKALTWVVLGAAVADGLLDPDAPIHESWTGEGQLSHPHKHLDTGHHATLTWRHLIGRRDDSLHWGGFPFEIGNRWAEKRTGLEEADAVSGVPEWAQWTGDPFYDCYAHAAPGAHGLYSSAGFWRLGQALTAVWGRDIKDVVQERLFDALGIPAERWGWLTGREVKEQKHFYRTIPDSYTYLDPPYEIDDHVVRSGPGWVVISASDWARFGLLNATRGIWKGERVIDADWLRGHSGGNKSGASGESEHFTALGVVTAVGLPDYRHAVETQSILPDDMFVPCTGADASCSSLQARQRARREKPRRSRDPAPGAPTSPPRRRRRRRRDRTAATRSDTAL